VLQVLGEHDAPLDGFQHDRHGVPFASDVARLIYDGPRP
jgi:hypothetical protein